MRAAVASGIVVIALAGQARAATQIGETFVPTDNCSPNTRIQSSSPGAQYAAPFAGVITSWSFRSSSSGGEAPIKLKVARGGGDSFTVVAETEFETAPDLDALNAFSTRIPVQAGDLVGLYAAPASVFLCARSATGFVVHRAALGDDLAIGAATTLTAVPDQQLGVSALLEADADRDGFGDESQDGCPTDATTQGPCPDTDPPQTTISKGAPKETDKTTVKFAFRSDEQEVSFACKLDKKSWKPCTSPRKVKRLKAGKHKFRVRATDAAGNTDPSPAKDKFKVV